MERMWPVSSTPVTYMFRTGIQFCLRGLNEAVWSQDAVGLNMPLARALLHAGAVVSYHNYTTHIIGCMKKRRAELNCVILDVQEGHGNWRDIYHLYLYRRTPVTNH